MKLFKIYIINIVTINQERTPKTSNIINSTYVHMYIYLSLITVST